MAGVGVRTAVAVLVLATLAQVRADGLSAEFRISPEGTFSLIESPALAMTPAGDFVAVWSTGTVLIQRYNSSGGAVGGVIRADETYPGVSPRPDVAVAPDRSFVIVWEAYVDTTNTTAILGRRFDAAGAPLGAPFQVSTQSQLNHVTAAAAMDGDGSFIVAWAAHDPNGGVTVLTRRFAPSGEPATGELVIGSLSFNYAKPTPDVVFGDAGTALVAWKDESEAINLSSVAAGGAVNTVALTTTSTPRQTPRIARTDEGFVAAWLSYSSSYAGTFDVIARRFAASGVPLADESQVNVTTRVRGYDEIGPSLALASSPTSGWVLAWRVARLDATGSEIGARAYAADGSPLGDEFRVDTGESSKHPAAGMAADGDYTLAYLVEDAYANPVGVYGRRWNDDPPADLAVAVTESSDPAHWYSGVEYHIRVDNLTLPGPDSTGVSVAVTVNGGDVEQAGGTDWVCTGGSPLIDCHLQGPLPAGAQAGDLALLVRAPGMSTTMTVEASVVAEQDDPDLANNTAAESTTIADLEPDPFYFAPRDGVEPGSEQTSDAVTISGLEAPAPIAVYGGFYSINGGPFTDVTGVIGPGDQVQLRHTAATEPGASQSTMLRINYSYGWFQTSTVGDATPDPFSFPDRTGVAPSAEQVSDPVTITGLTVGASIRADLGPENSEYSIDDGPFTSEQRLIYDGQTVRVRHTSAACGNCLSETRLWIGDVAGTFRSYTQPPDTTPDQTAFPDALNVLRSTEVLSEPMVITGITDDTSIRIQWSYNADAYSIDGGPFTAEPGLIRSGQSLRVRHTSSQYFSSDVRTDLIFGSQNGPSGSTETLVTFRSRTQDQDAAPDPVSFPDRSDVPRNTEVVSDPVIITGVTDDTPVSIANGHGGGEYSIDNGPFTAEPGFIRSGQSLRLRHLSSQSFSTETRTDVLFGSGAAFLTFRSRTRDQDTTPDPFSFGVQDGVARNTTVVSDPVVIAGIDEEVVISVAGGEYSIDGAPFTSSPGLVDGGQSVRVQHVSSSAFGGSVETTLTIGTAWTTFRSTTQAQDVVPDPFAFASRSDVEPGSEQVSDAVTILGITDDTPVAVTGGEYSIGGAPFTAAPATIANGQSVRVRHAAAAEFGGSVTTTLAVGDGIGSFTTTTRAGDGTPDAFTFTDLSGQEPDTDVISNEVLVGGIEIPVAIDVAGGLYSIDGGAFTSAPGTVANGQRVRLQQRTAAGYEAPTGTTLNIGGVADTFTTTTRAGDACPDPYDFLDQTGVPLDTLIMSDPVTVTGIEVPVDVVATVGTTFSIDGGPFGESGAITSGQTLRLQHHSSPMPKRTAFSSVMIGCQGASWRTETAYDEVPDPFGFATQAGVPRTVLVTSEEVVIGGFDTAVSATATGGSFSVNGGPWLDGNQTVGVGPGDRVRVQHVSSPEFDDTRTTQLTLGTVTGAFTSRTFARDTTPDPFTFTDPTGVERGTTQTSNAIVVSSINSAAQISVSGGSYSVDGGTFTTAAGTVVSGASVRVRHVSSPAFATSVTTTLTIGGVAESFVTTTVAQDVTPDSFAFASRTGVARTTAVVSDAVTIAGINDASPIGVTSGAYSVNGAAFTTASGNVVAGDSVRVQHTSSSVFSGSVTTTLVVGGVSGQFTSTTLARDVSPDPFAFVDVTNVARSTTQTSGEVTITGINDAAPISVSGGKYSIDGGPFKASAGTIASGQKVRVRHTSSASFATSVNTVLTVGGVSDTFTSTTEPRDTTPNAFGFASKDNVAVNTMTESDDVAVGGINDAAPISVAGGEYSVNGGVFTPAAGTVGPNEVLRVRHASAATFSTSRQTVLTIGGVSGTFTSATEAEDTTPDAFSFEDRTGVLPMQPTTSNAVTIAGINAPTGITLTGADGAWSVNGGAFTSAAGMLRAGDSVALRVTSAAAPQATVEVIVTIGGVVDRWTVRTLL